MTIRNKNIQVQVKIDSFTKEGRGFGSFIRHDEVSCPVEVPFAIPGDVAKVQLLPKRSGIYHSRLIEIVEGSLDRIPPRCIHFGICGGCRFQQITYENQRRLKEGLIQKCFPDISYTFHSAESIWQHRNKMEFTFSSDSAKNHYLGLIMDGSRGKVFNLTECHLTEPWFAETVIAVRNWWKETPLEAYHPSKNTGSLRTLTLREGKRTGDRMAFLTVSGNPAYAITKQQMEQFAAVVRQVAGSSTSIFVRIHQSIKGKPTQFFEMHLSGPDHIKEVLHIEDHSLTFTISPSAFFQPNTAMAEKLYSKVVALAGPLHDQVVYDLYCGTGTLGICMAKKAKAVIGIELSADAAYDARNNAALNNLNNITIFTGAVEDKLKEIVEGKEHPLPDIVVLDPPRAGLDPRAIEQIKVLMPPKIIYVSCNPVSQAKNITELLAFGYQIISMDAVDQFPHTPHIENVVVLTL